jgi:hypothetical protein
MRIFISSSVAYLVGLLYPAFATFKAIKRAEQHHQQDPGWSDAATSSPSRKRGSASSSSSTASLTATKRYDLDNLLTQWLMYWIVMAVYTVFEVLCETFLLAGLWFPFYHELKVLFILWLTLPQFRGATKIYRRFLAPTLETYENDIDGHLDVARRRVSKELGRGVAATGDFVRKRGSHIFRSIASSVSSIDGAAAEESTAEEEASSTNQKDK